MLKGSEEMSRTFTICLLLLLTAVNVYSLQPGFTQRERLPKFNLYHYQELNADTPATTLVVEVRLANDDLQFEKDPNGGFNAGAQVTAELFAGKEQISVAHAWQPFQRQVTAFNSTHADDSELAATFQLNAAPGDYTLWVRVQDLVTNRSQVVRQKVYLSDLSGQGLYISKPALRIQVTDGGDGVNEWQPTPEPQKGLTTDPLGLALECWSQAAQQLQLALTVTAEGEQILRRDTTMQISAGGRISWVVPLPVDLPRDSYLADADLKTAAGDEMKSASQFKLIRPGSEPQVEDVDMAIEQLRYIASRKSMKRLRAALPHQRETLFNNFWKELDPTPATPENELQYEYYRRIDVVDRQYPYGLTPGWRTDRGRIYITYGPPDNIEQHPYEIETPPYEIWNYYEKELRLVFVDRHGFGDYRLTNYGW